MSTDLYECVCAPNAINAIILISHSNYAIHLLQTIHSCTHLNSYDFIRTTHENSENGMPSIQSPIHPSDQNNHANSFIPIILKLPWPQISCIFGRKSKQSVAVVDVNINAVIVRNANVTRSDIKLAKTTTIALVITTL